MLLQIIITKLYIKEGLLHLLCNFLFNYLYTLREQIGAASIAHICKSILIKNTRCRNSDCSNPYDSLYYLVVVQYVAKMNCQQIYHVIRDLAKGPKKGFHFRVAGHEDAEKLTGFVHGAVSPFGLKTNIPIILDSRITQLTPRYFYSGGGDVRTKVGCLTEEFIEKMNPIIAEVTIPRPQDYDGLNGEDDEDEDNDDNQDEDNEGEENN